MQEPIMLICEELLQEAQRLANSDDTNPLLAGEQTGEPIEFTPRLGSREQFPSLLQNHEHHGSQRLFMVKPFTEVIDDPEGTN